MATVNRDRAFRACPSCGSTGKSVKPITVESLVVDAARARAGRTDAFRFCAEPSCDVAYFHLETGVRISKDEVRVRIGQKATQAPRPVCYCFEHTVEEIEAEVFATGTSKVADDITAKCREGLDRCEETNPQGFRLAGMRPRRGARASPPLSLSPTLRRGAAARSPARRPRQVRLGVRATRDSGPPPAPSSRRSCRRPAAGFRSS
jgi:hypothetical protein